MQTAIEEISFDELLDQEAVVLPPRRLMQTVSATITVSVTLTTTGLSVPTV